MTVLLMKKAFITKLEGNAFVENAENGKLLE